MEKLKRAIVEGKKVLVESIIGKTVTIVDLNDAGKGDWDMNDAEYKKLLSYEGKKAKVHSIGVDNGKEDENYYNIEFSDGYVLDALSAEHIKELK
jgi:hypothetical protein